MGVASLDPARRSIGRLARFHGVWCVPASPDANTQGALAAIRCARRTQQPFSAPAAGSTRAARYAEAVWGVCQPAHAELNPEHLDPVIAPLACGLLEVSGDIASPPARGWPASTACRPPPRVITATMG